MSNIIRKQKNPRKKNGLDSLISKYDKVLGLLNRKELLLAITVAIAIVVLGVFMGYENNKLIPSNPAPLSHYLLEPHNRLSFMSNWDGPNYLTIARSGYSTESLTNFFPVYPITISLVNKIVSSELDSALLVSWVCLVGAIYFYLKIIKLLYREKNNFEALRAVLFFIIFPTGVFLLATYTESMFALFALGSIYYALRNRYLLAGLFALITTATHVNGIFVVALGGILLIQQRQKIKNILTFLVLGSLGLISYMTYLYAKFKKPLAFISAQKSHGWLHWSITNYFQSIGWLNMVFLVLIVISVFYWWTKNKGFAIYSLFFLIMPFIGGQFGGYNRYVLMDFPLQIMFYDRFKDSHIGYQICFGVSAILWSYFLFQYAGGYVGG